MVCGVMGGERLSGCLAMDGHPDWLCLAPYCILKLDSPTKTLSSLLKITISTL